MESYQRFLKPDVLAKLQGLDVKARLVVEGFLAGLHKSPYHGFSVEFAEYRQYMPGDELKRVDWKVYGRSDRYYVKEFEEETNLKAYLLLDTSASMGYHQGASDSKLAYGACLAAALGWFTKWAIGRFDATTAAFQASMEKHNAALLVVIGDQKAQHQQSIDTVARNTVAIEQITKTLEYCRARNGERT